MNTEKKLSAILLGLIVIGAGAGYIAAALGYIESFTIFFDGWWAVLFIMLPSFCSLFNRESNKFLCLAGLLAGAALLLWSQGILTLPIGKLILPIIAIVVGISIIVSAFTGHSHNNQNTNGNGYTDVDTSVAYPKYSAVFGDCHPNYNGQVFAGCKAEAVFGETVIDLRSAILQNESNVEATAVFGETEIILPQNCTLDLHSSEVFGAVNNTHINTGDAAAPIIHIKAEAVFGDVDIR